MGEYATYQGQSVKIGTCEDMLYLRADQAHLVRPERGSINPITDAPGLRFRFPWPDEDHIAPGAFRDPFRTLGICGVPLPDGIDHGHLQFTRNYPQAGGIILSIPCPEVTPHPGVAYNGYSGKVHIAQQRLWEGKLVLVCKCGSCGTAYRLPTLADAQPIIDRLYSLAEQNRADRDARVSFWETIAHRIHAGYTEPNTWTKASLAHNPELTPA